MDPQSYYRCKTWASKPMFCIFSSFESMNADKALLYRKPESSQVLYIEGNKAKKRFEIRHQRNTCAELCLKLFTMISSSCIDL